MSAKYAKEKGYFDKGLWTLRQVKDAVAKGWITAEEFVEIMGDTSGYTDANRNN